MVQAGFLCPLPGEGKEPWRPFPGMAGRPVGEEEDEGREVAGIGLSPCFLHAPAVSEGPACCGAFGKAACSPGRLAGAARVYPFMRRMVFVVE